MDNHDNSNENNGHDMTLKDPFGIRRILQGLGTAQLS